jgi:hypothetical protein
MEETARISDDVFEKETAGTIFEDYDVYLAMLIFCRFDNRTYTEQALVRELRQLNPEIKKGDMPSILNPLIDKNYVGTKGDRKKIYFPKEEGIKIFVDLYNRLLEQSNYPKKILKPRKSFVQEYNEKPVVARVIYLNGI